MLEARINDMWSGVCDVDFDCISEVIGGIDDGSITVVTKIDTNWVVNEWVKKAILLYMKHSKCKKIADGFDKVPLKTSDWSEEKFEKAGFRMVPGSIVRYGAYIAPGAIIMPSFVNIGAYVGAKTMIDTHATVGSCARVGERCHISDGVTIGGVLEPIQGVPVVIEDDCFIGAGSRVTEGVWVQNGAVLGAGTVLTKSTPIIDRDTGNVSYGVVPAYSVVIPGSRMITPELSTSCAIIVKKADESTRSKTSINDLLRQTEPGCVVL